jgi:hypothetical protein
MLAATLIDMLTDPATRRSRQEAPHSLEVATELAHNLIHSVGNVTQETVLVP